MYAQLSFLKKGLQHTYILVWLVSKFKCRIADDVDSIVLTEIPDMNIDPLCHEIISKFMIHVPCNIVNLNAQCMLEVDVQSHFQKNSKIQLFLVRLGLFIASDVNVMIILFLMMELCFAMTILFCIIKSF